MSSKKKHLFRVLLYSSSRHFDFILFYHEKLAVYCSRVGRGIGSKFLFYMLKIGVSCMANFSVHLIAGIWLFCFDRNKSW